MTSKMLTSAYNKFAVLKRRPDFDEEILLPRKAAKPMAAKQAQNRTHKAEVRKI